MENIETVYQAIIKVNRSVAGQITKAHIADIMKLTHLSYEQVFTALKQLYADDRITASITQSTGRDNYGEPLNFDFIVALTDD